jgi:hypothetical protein
LTACSEVVGASQHEEISKHFFSKPCKKEGTSAFSLGRYNRLEDAIFPLMRALPLIGQDHGD